MGLTDSRSWAGGIDVTYVLNPDLSFMVGYKREYATQLLLGQIAPKHRYGYGAGNCVSHARVRTLTNDKTNCADTFTAAVKYAAIPSKLDPGLRYTLSHGVDTSISI